MTEPCPDCAVLLDELQKATLEGRRLVDEERERNVTMLRERAATLEDEARVFECLYALKGMLKHAARELRRMADRIEGGGNG
jgi:hypothetical protein